jgi:hypothetical protein
MNRKVSRIEAAERICNAPMWLIKARSSTAKVIVGRGTHACERHLIEEIEGGFGDERNYNGAADENRQL